MASANLTFRNASQRRQGSFQRRRGRKRGDEKMIDRVDEKKKGATAGDDGLGLKTG
jgi:hypothetical protein